MTRRTLGRCGFGSTWHWLRRRRVYRMTSTLHVDDDSERVVDEPQHSPVCEVCLGDVIARSIDVDYGAGLVAHGRSVGSHGLFTRWYVA